MLERELVSLADVRPAVERVLVVVRGDLEIVSVRVLSTLARRELVVRLSVFPRVEVRVAVVVLDIVDFRPVPDRFLLL